VVLEFIESRLTVLLGDPQGLAFSERGDEAMEKSHRKEGLLGFGKKTVPERLGS